MTNQVWQDDPRRLVFVLARYKFVSKMFAGLQNVLEIGCADAFASRIVLQEVGRLTVVDFDPLFIADVRERMDPKWPLIAIEHDMLAAPVAGNFDGAYALDVLEHIPAAGEDRFMENIARSLAPSGRLIVGVPSPASQEFASPQSKTGHVNIKDHDRLRDFLSHFFSDVFLFSMNDEVVHTGFYPLANYYLALCCGKKELD